MRGMGSSPPRAARCVHTTASTRFMQLIRRGLTRRGDGGDAVYSATSVCDSAIQVVCVLLSACLLDPGPRYCCPHDTATSSRCSILSMLVKEAVQTCLPIHRYATTPYPVHVTAHALPHRSSMRYRLHVSIAFRFAADRHDREHRCNSCS